MTDFKYKITERIAILSKNGEWTKELNKVSWNDRDGVKINEGDLMFSIIVSDEEATVELKVGTYRYFKDIEGTNLNPEKLIADLYSRVR